MPLTRRVQVFLNEEASDKFDLLLKAHKLGPTALIQTLIFQANPLDALPTKTDRQPDTKLDGSAKNLAEDSEGNIYDPRYPQIVVRLPRAGSGDAQITGANTRGNRGDGSPFPENSPQTSLDAVGPTVESGRGKASVETIRPKPLPLERKQVVSIPKPGKGKK